MFISKSLGNNSSFFLDAHHNNQRNLKPYQVESLVSFDNIAPKGTMVDKVPTNTSWRPRRHGTLTLPGVDECDIPRGSTLKPSESELSETVTPVTDLGRSVSPNPFEKSFTRDWGNKDFSGRVWTVRSAQSLSVDVFRERLFKRFSRSALDKSEYLPRDAFEQLFDMDSLVGLVKASFP